MGKVRERFEVVQRARAVLARHEEKEHSVSEELSSEASPSPVQTSIFPDPTEHGIGEELRMLDLNALRPIEALTLLEKWAQRLNTDKGPEAAEE